MEDGPKVTAPGFMTPEQFAEHFGWSPRKVRSIAREIGACRIVGNKMILVQQDIDAILEASKPIPMDAQSAEPTAKGRPPSKRDLTDPVWVAQRARETWRQLDELKRKKAESNKKAKSLPTKP